MSADLLCITAAQRSGTTALRSSLERTGAFFDHGEIFHPSPGNQRAGAFLPFAREEGVTFADMAEEADALAVAERYVAHLRAVAGDKASMLDIKFNSWWALSPFWNYPAAKPFFMRFLLGKFTRFIVLRRRNLTEQLASEWLARATNVWHGLDDDQVDTPIEVDLVMAGKLARLIVRAENMMTEKLGGHPHATFVDYEDLFVDGRIQTAPLSRVFEDFNVPNLEYFGSNIERNRVHKATKVANYAELVAIVTDVSERYQRAP